MEAEIFESCEEFSKGIILYTPIAYSKPKHPSKDFGFFQKA